MRRLLQILGIVLLAGFVSCEVKMPEHIIPPEKMEAFLYDYHLVQSMSGEYSASDYKEKLFFGYTFDKHGITKEQFDSSMMWYNRYPKHLKRIYERLEARAETEVAELDAARGTLNEGISLDVAFLDTDTAELWTSSKVRMLTSTPLSNRMIFSFTTPEDSSFVPGDSLQFSFSALFYKDSLSVFNQHAYAAVLFEYDDKSSESKGVMLKTGGDYLLAVNRNVGSRLKSMNGFVYYSDSASCGNAGVVLSDISVRRFHVKDDARKKTED